MVKLIKDFPEACNVLNFPIKPYKIVKGSIMQ